MAKYDGASEYLCSSGHLLETIEQVQNTWSQSKQIQDEAKIVWFMIHRGIKPDRPTIDGKNEMNSFDLNVNLLQNVGIHRQIFRGHLAPTTQMRHLCNIAFYSVKASKSSIRIQRCLFR